MKNYKVGDNVAVYFTSEGNPCRTEGIIIEALKLPLKPPADTHYVRVQTGAGTLYAHPKQCRRLKRKEKKVPVG